VINQLLFNSLQNNLGNSDIKPIVRLFNTDIASIVGPTPFVDISRSFESDDNTCSITLTGKIAPLGSGSINSIANGIRNLEGLLQRCKLGPFQILCNNIEIYGLSGVSVKQFQVDKNDNNWVRFADYSITLEQKLPTVSGAPIYDYVESKSDVWNIEQLEDAQYHSFMVQTAVNSGPEYLSKNMKPAPPTVGSPRPRQTVQGGSITNNQDNLQVHHAAQYRITRRISARGLPIIPSGSSSTCITSSAEVGAIKLNNAKLWVENEASKNIYNLSLLNQGDGFQIFQDNFTTGMIQVRRGTHLYNHIRTVSADLYSGTYELNDSWLAMPTGINHTEKYTIECSTSENFTKTIRVVGNINGLTKHDPVHHLGNDSFFKQRSGGSNVLEVNVSGGSKYSSTTAIEAHSLASVSGQQSSSTIINKSKYLNALDAWNNDIKPYLYRRACLGINTGDREARPATPRTDGGGRLVPESPAFFVDRILSPIPVNTSEGHDPLNGTISYSYEFNNKYKAISGVISENINISYDAPADNISETPILGRYLGPLIQSIGRSNPRKTVSVDVIVQPPINNEGMLMSTWVGQGGGTAATNYCPVGVPTELRRQIAELIKGNEPFSYRNPLIFGTSARSNQPGTVYVQSDQESWNPTEGRYSRTVSWTYQHCTTNLNYMDH
jgi:hypothetical protein